MLKCVDCGAASNGARCRVCYEKFAREDSRKHRKKCVECGELLDRQTKGDYCYRHRLYNAAAAEKVFTEESAVAPSLPTTPSLHGDFIVISDPHIPFHDPQALLKACEVGRLLGITSLVIAGDLLHADIISKYDRAGKQVAIGDELVSCGRVLSALTTAFDEVHIIVGNHDQRFEKLVASWRKTENGAKALELVAKMLGVQDDADAVAYGMLEHFFANDKVKLYPLPDLTINDKWLVLHPGSCSRVPPQNERKLAHKYRKSVVGGHNHLFGIGFDDSAVDVAANIGHCCDPSKFRYIRERPTTFPMSTVRGFCAIITDETSPGGRLLPIAIHDRWFDLAILAQRLERNSGREMPVVR